MKTLSLVLGWVVAGLAVAFCVGAAIKYWGEFTSYHTELSVWMLILGFAFTLTAYLSGTTGWSMLMSSIGSPIRFLTALRASSYSLLASYVPGKVLAILVSVQICKEDGASPSKVLTGTVLGVILRLVSSLTIWLLSSLHSPAIWGLSRMWYLTLLIPMLAALHPKVIMIFMGAYYRLRGASYEQEVPHMKLISILRPGGLYFLGQLLYGTGGYFILRSVVSIPIGTVSSIVPLVGIFPFAWAIGYMFFIVPGGLGAREGVLIWALQTWVPLSVAVVVSLLARLCQISLVLGLAATLWIVHHWRK